MSVSPVKFSLCRKLHIEDSRKNVHPRRINDRIIRQGSKRNSINQTSCNTKRWGGCSVLITCDNNMQMGYIYLMPNEATAEYTLDKSDIGLYYDVISLSIPRIKWLSMGQSLSQMRLATNTYREAVDKAFHCEYWNDLDNEGYMMGIELYLTEEIFLPLIAHQAFKLYDIRWRNRDFRVVTLDAYHDVLNKNNVIYPLTLEKDAFVIVAIDPLTKIGKIMALISARDDLYPIDYLRNPLFMLANSSRYFSKA